MTPPQVLLALSLFWAGTANLPLLSAALAEHPAARAATWALGAALVSILVGLHLLLLTVSTPRVLLKPVGMLLLFVAAASGFHAAHLGVHLDPAMLRNVLHTDWAEARELLTPALGLHLLLYAVLPAGLLLQLPIARQPLRQAALQRAGLLMLALLLVVVPLALAFKPLASLIRNHRELRYQATPANVLWSGASLIARSAQGAARPREPIGLDARPGPCMAARSAAGAKPLVFVLVVGETARAANWGLNPGARETTPALARLDVINFPSVRSCGTDTETSLPCMFAPVGRRAHDDARIRRQQSLLHVLARAGVDVHWVDNQSGCKGVCDGLQQESTASLGASGLCDDGHCLDEALLLGLPQRLARAKGTQLLVLHMIGNHGPAYFRRYPPAFEHFKPACREDDLARCTQQEIANAYDNALRYTDHVLSSLIATLQSQAGRVDTALLYVSDHGESLGENGLYLHGMPWPFAPEVQKRVPMVMWLSAGAPAALGVDDGCLRARAAQPAEHDHLFHSLLTLLDVRTALHDPGWDLAGPCRLARAP